MKYTTDGTDKRIAGNNKALFSLVSLRPRRYVGGSNPEGREDEIRGNLNERLLRHFVPRNDTLLVSRNHSSGRSIRKNRAQSILEYAILIGIIAAVLSAMQIYFRRGIQAVIKVAADEVGEQKKGLLEYDYKNEWKKRGASTIDSESTRQMTSSLSNGGAVTYDSQDESTRKGTLSYDVIKEE